jgi:hypothetical protein
VIIAIRGEGLVEGDDEDAAAAASSGANNQRLMYALHPNCGLFDGE